MNKIRLFYLLVQNIREFGRDLGETIDQMVKRLILKMFLEVWNLFRIGGVL
jgi:hypothetical protein